MFAYMREVSALPVRLWWAMRRPLLVERAKVMVLTLFQQHLNTNYPVAGDTIMDEHFYAYEQEQTNENVALVLPVPAGGQLTGPASRHPGGLWMREHRLDSL